MGKDAFPNHADPDAETTDRGGRVALLFAAAIRNFQRAGGLCESGGWGRGMGTDLFPNLAVLPGATDPGDGEEERPGSTLLSPRGA